MKTIQKLIAIVVVSAFSFNSTAQNIDDERMTRDIEVAENVLATLIKQEFEQRRTFFGLDVKGSYQPGYGVTFRVPADHSLPFVFSIGGNELNPAVIADDYSYTVRTAPPPPPALDAQDSAVRLKNKDEERRQKSVDSVRSEFNNRIIRAAQNFILDYGDIISQLGSNERIVVTNQSDRPQVFFATGGPRTRIAVEGSKTDIVAFRQGKLDRSAALKKLKVVNTETLEAREPDMEMISSIFSRLYRPDLSKTYFIEGNVYYERLRDFGTIFYLQMVSSVDRQGRHLMPTLGVEGLTQEERDKKVTDLYPQFEREMKDNILEYGRTVKTLKDDESLIFNIIMTRCKGCGIPGTLELSIKGSVLRDFSSGKIDKNTALSKMTVKKGAGQ